MICRFSVENFKAFSNKAELDFFANGNIKRFDYNYTNVNDKKVLKTIGFYGPNNTGKTCILFALLDLRSLMLNQPHDSLPNAFANKGDVTKFEVEYCVDNRFYTYQLDYDDKKKQYEREKLVLKTVVDGSVVSKRIFERSSKMISWEGIDPLLKNINFLKFLSLSIPFMVAFDNNENRIMEQARKDYLTFANSILFLKMDGPVDISKTIQLMQNDSKAKLFIKEFVKNCDLHIDDFGFDDNVVCDTNIDDQIRNAQSNPNFIKESLKLYSRHNGYRVPSIFFDSVGTQKLVALSGYIYEALHNGKILIVDEIDSSLHHILTKSIVAMFSNMLNNKAQLIFTTHDALLLDLKELFRKDQIYLIDILDKSSSKIYRLSDFTARTENGIRGDENIIEYYLKGQFGSIPTPDLFTSLEEAVSNEPE